eukprot:gene6179-6417_t
MAEPEPVLSATQLTSLVLDCSDADDSLDALATIPSSFLIGIMASHLMQLRHLRIRIDDRDKLVLALRGPGLPHLQRLELYPKNECTVGLLDEIHQAGPALQASRFDG